MNIPALKANRPPKRLPKQIETGIGGVDSYLGRLNSQLIGSASVRRIPLLEARDYLLEFIEHVPAEAHDQAILDAARSYGSPEEVGRIQRNERWRAFRSTAWRTGLGFSILMLILGAVSIDGLDAVGMVSLLVGFCFNFVFFGCWMGLYFALFDAPTLCAAASDENEDVFTVKYPRKNQAVVALLFVFFASLVGFFIAEKFGVGPLAGRAVPMSYSLLILVLITHLLLSCLDAMFLNVNVQQGSLLVRRLGRRDSVELKQLLSFELLPFWQQILYPGFGRIWRLSWQEPDLKPRSVLIALNHELENHDRLLALVERKLQGKQAARFRCL